MKRLLILTAVALMMFSAAGCECCGVGNGGMMQMFRGRSRCNSCSPCDSCSSFNSGEPVMQTSGCGCGCGTPTMGAPTITPGPESYSMSR